MLSHKAITAWAAMIVLVGAGMAVWLLLAYTDGDTDANRVQLDAIRTAGAVVVGTGGAAALLLAARRQRSTEIALRQKDLDQALQERVAAATEVDAEARRITDLYTKAADQLGSEKAPVRLAGLYALDRLAQDHVEQRQTIVNVLCAYLRMPYTLPGDPPADDADNKLVAAHDVRVQEREVRLAAQYILALHLSPNGDPDEPLDDEDCLDDEDSFDDEPLDTYWANIDLVLTGANLIDLNLSHCTIRTAQFEGATFAGDAWFYNVTFTRDAWFTQATFTNEARFDSATFIRDARFDDSTFTGNAWFSRTTFRYARFSMTTFTGDANFPEATFTTTAHFNGATLPSTRYTDVNTPSPSSNFRGSSFGSRVPVEVARFVSPSNEDATDAATG